MASDGVSRVPECTPRTDTSQETAYIPIRVLGRGAFGEAVLYRRVEDNTLVVWKEVDLKRLNEKERRDSQNEIDILSILNHTNIVSYYNHFLDGDTLLIEMEYANGGNLCEKISRQKELFPEEVVLWYFHQVISAVGHIHDFSILHRDLKTLNIFLTKAGVVKVGDFGISRVLSSKSQMADSYVGTPYYMSPELIKGEKYNQKSDVWASGCVLYELLTLTKVFNATNPLKLAHEIVRSDFAEIDARYSKGIRSVVNAMLDKDPVKRPEAEEVLRLPILSQMSDEFEKRLWELNSASRRARMSTSVTTDILPVVTSKSSEVHFWGGGKATPQKLEIFSKGRSPLQVAAGHAHFAVVTIENELYTWANAQGSTNMVGQLGHSDRAAYKAPKKVDDFDGIPIKQVSCGEDFTVCVTDEGTVYSFGSDYYGCLGCDNTEGEQVCTPVLVEFFTSRPVTQVSCGDAHVVALTRDFEVYTWGCGEFGRLGLGSEDDHAAPQRVQTRGKHAIKEVIAGSDGTFLINTNGRVQACGSNESNKLGFNSAAQGLRKRKEQISFDIPYKTTFSTVKPLSKYHIVTVAAGHSHTAALDVYGHLMTFGANTYGQLGVGDFKTYKCVCIIRGALTGKQVEKVAVGDACTIIATSDKQVYSWGVAENGRLGHIPGDKGRGPGGNCFSLPRPIFGSLHLVSHMASHHWHTIIVAEKVLAQKTIKSPSPATKAAGTFDTQVSCDSVFLEGSGSGQQGAGQRGEVSQDSGVCTTQPSHMGESSVPGWLKAELADEFIPVGGASREPAKNGHHSNSSLQPERIDTNNSDVPPWLKQELVNSEFIPMVATTPPIVETSPSGSRSRSGSSEGHSVLVSSLNTGTLGSAPRGPSSQKREDAEGVCEKELIAQLRQQVIQLERQNQQLQQMVTSQAAAIKQLEMQNDFYHCTQSEIWELIETWKADCTAAIIEHAATKNRHQSVTKSSIWERGVPVDVSTPVLLFSQEDRDLLERLDLDHSILEATRARKGEGKLSATELREDGVPLETKDDPGVLKQLSLASELCVRSASSKGSLRRQARMSAQAEDSGFSNQEDMLIINTAEHAVHESSGIEDCGQVPPENPTPARHRPVSITPGRSTPGTATEHSSRSNPPGTSSPSWCGHTEPGHGLANLSDNCVAIESIDRVEKKTYKTVMNISLSLQPTTQEEMV